LRVPTAVSSVDVFRRIDLRRLLTHDVPLKAAAIALTAILWIAAAGSTPKDVTVAFDGRVPVERPEVPAGYVVRGSIGDVGVKLRGPAAAVGAVGQQDLHATFDLASLDLGRTEAQELPVRVTVADERVKVVEVSPAAIALRVERVTTRAFTVQARFANDPPAGFQPGRPVFTPTEVRVSGPGSLVALVTAVYATVRFGDVGVDIIQSAQVQAVDAAGKAVDGVTVEPAGVQVNVPILPTATTRTVPILWILRGTVAPGYWISRVSTDPVAVTVRGDPNVLGQLDRIETAAVDIGGLAGNRTFRASLTLPDGVSLVRPADATVTVVVSPLSGTRPFPLVAVQVNGVASGLTADVDPKTVDVVVGGQLAQLGALKPEDVVASVDVAGRGAGPYALDVSVKLPQGVTLVSAQPARATVTLKPKT